jgi:hypothetical protein
MLKRAETLLLNTKRLRFFRGETYDGGADEYLRQLHGFLDDYIAEQKAKQESAAHYQRSDNRS